MVVRRLLLLSCTVCVAHLVWLLIRASEGGESAADISLRNADFPHTYISRIHLDLTSPNHLVRLVWSGPAAAQQNAGPFRSSPGAGWGNNDCNDPIESNCPDSRCTPKGLRTVEGLLDHMADDPALRFVTVIDKRRAVSFHSHPVIPEYPASKGCVRLEPHAAQLIHDNSIVGVTEIQIDGAWTKPITHEASAKTSASFVQGRGRFAI